MTPNEKAALIRRASRMPKGSDERFAILVRVAYSKKIRTASFGVRYAFNLKGLVQQILEFVASVGDKLAALSKSLEKSGLNNAGIQALDKVAAPLAEALEKAAAEIQRGTKVATATTPRRAKMAGFLAVGAGGMALSSAARSAGARSSSPRGGGGWGGDEAGSRSLNILIGAVVATATLPIWLPLWGFVRAVEVVLGNVKYVGGVEDLGKEGTRSMADDLSKFARSKSGWLEKIARFLSKIVHSKPNPDPFGDKGAAFDLYMPISVSGRLNVTPYQAAHFGRYSWDGLDAPIAGAYDRLMKDAERLRGKGEKNLRYSFNDSFRYKFFVYDNVAKSWWGLPKHEKLWESLDPNGKWAAVMENFIKNDIP